MNQSGNLRKRFLLAIMVLIVAFLSLTMATFAWYVFQTGARTSKVHMAVGTGTSLQISNTYEDGYSSSAVLDQFEGMLVPVSTDKISGGFQHAMEFENQGNSFYDMVASVFGQSESEDREYYKATLFLRCSGGLQNVYVSNIGYEDDDPENPISTAIRVGLVIHENGLNQPASKEYIFAINTAENPNGRHYNTKQGEIGHVLDSSKTDGSTVPFTNLYTPENYCIYDSSTGEVTLQSNSAALLQLIGDGEGGYGEATQVDVYIWLEGCDEDCYNNLSGKILSKIALSFASKLI